MTREENHNLVIPADRGVVSGPHRASEPEQQTSRARACDAHPALSRTSLSDQGDRPVDHHSIPTTSSASRECHEAICLRLRAITRWQEHAAAGRCVQSMADEAERELRAAIERIERGEQ